MKQAPSLLH